MPDAHGKASKSTTGRRKGGQPGNKNGLRHGFYSHLWTIRTGKELAGSLIDDEIAMYRYKALALANLTPLKHPDEEELKIYDRLIATGITINTLERTRLLARGHGGEMGQTILEALREMNPYEDLE
jgi:hypothetical protein